MRLAVGVFLIEYERFQVEDAKLIQRLLVLVADREPSHAARVRDDFFEVGSENDPSAAVIDSGDARIERRR